MPRPTVRAAIISAPPVIFACLLILIAAAPPPVVEETPVAADETDFSVEALLAPYRGLTPDAVTFGARADRWADSVLATLTLDQKIGQLLIVDMRADWLVGVRNLEQVARDLGIGGFHVPRAMAPRAALQATNRLQRVAHVPLFFTADYERGAGTSADGFGDLPSAMAFGAAGSEALAEAAGAVTAIEARAAGVNILFAPVADVNSDPRNPIIGTRAFSGDPTLVGRMAAAYVRGAQRHGALATLKHFPGHGNTETDTHVAFGVVNGSAEHFRQNDLRAFEVAVRDVAPDDKPALVMTAHLWAPALEPTRLPSTFSHRALTGVLRGDLQYDGLIITDAVTMAALRRNYPLEERILRPIQAGADLVLNTYDPRRAISIVRGAVADGRLSERRIDQSVRRILRAKAALGLDAEREADARRLETILAINRSGLVANEAAVAAITALGNGSTARLRARTPATLIQISDTRSSPAMDRLEQRLNEGRLLTAHRVNSRANAGDRTRAIAAARAAAGNDVVVALHTARPGSGGARLSDSQASTARQVVNAARDAGANVMVVVFGSPYAVEDVDAPGALLAYCTGPASGDAVARVLTGMAPAAGRLPVRFSSNRWLSSGEAPDLTR
ncbi:hypothetical protein BH23BAC4_BH23BAC4_10540 [soil metagenome]